MRNPGLCCVLIKFLLTFCFHVKLLNEVSCSRDLLFVLFHSISVRALKAAWPCNCCVSTRPGLLRTKSQYSPYNSRLIFFFFFVHTVFLPWQFLSMQTTALNGATCAHLFIKLVSADIPQTLDDNSDTQQGYNDDKKPESWKPEINLFRAE